MKSITKLRVKSAGMVLVVGILFFGSIGLMTFFVMKGCEEITDRGLKNVIEEVWEGKQNRGETE